MTITQKFLITLQASSFLVILTYLFFHVYRAKQEAHKYKLYALRDRIILLVATHELREESVVYQAFYDTLIKTITEVKSVKLWSIAKASVTAKSVLQQQRSEQLKAELLESSPVVKKFVAEFYRTMMEIAVANSPLLVLFIKLANRDFVLTIGSYFTNLRLFIDEQQQYDVYKYFEKQSRFAT
jgi:hypothetical protein